MDGRLCVLFRFEFCPGVNFEGENILKYIFCHNSNYKDNKTKEKRPTLLLLYPWIPQSLFTLQGQHPGYSPSLFLPKDICLIVN